MNTILIGNAEEIDLLPHDVHAMLDHEGVYLCGDSDAPTATVPVVSMDGRLYSMKIDAELDPKRFKKTLTVAGPFHKPPNYCSAAKNDIATPPNPAPKLHHDAE